MSERLLHELRAKVHLGHVAEDGVPKCCEELIGDGRSLGLEWRFAQVVCPSSVHYCIIATKITGLYFDAVKKVLPSSSDFHNSCNCTCSYYCEHY